MALVFFAVFFVVGASALINSPSKFEISDGNMTLETSGNTDWNCFQGSGGFQGANYGPGAGVNTFTKSDCAASSGATDITADSAGELGQTGGQKFDTACPTFKLGNNPPKDEWANIAEYVEASTATNSDGGHDIYFYGASIRPVVNGNSSGNVYFSQGTNPAGAGCRTKGDILLTFDFLNGGGTTPVLHALTWEVGSGTCYVSSDSTSTGCWGPSNAPALSGDNSGGLTNGSVINGSDNAINGQTLLVNAFSEIGVNLTQAIKAAGGSATCFANQTWVSRSSGSSFTSSPEDVEVVSKPTCGTITIIKHTLDGAGNRTGIDQNFSYSSTGGLTPSSPTLNDGAGATGDVTCPVISGTCNTQTYSNQPAGSYTVTEGTNPPNFTFVSLTCTAAGNGTTAVQDGTILKKADITLGISGSVVCTYVNQQQLGAIRINKTSSKAAATALTGAKFYLCTNNVNSTSTCTAATNASGTTVTNPLTTTSGTVCVANLPLGQYYVFESAAPSGYAIDDGTAHSANVTAAGDCSTSTSASVTLPFTDTPLTDLSVHVASEVSGGTKSAIFCKDASNNSIGNSPQPTGAIAGTTSTYDDPLTLNADPTHGAALTPGTYTCTVIIDP
jgi:hypothetical protein